MLTLPIALVLIIVVIALALLSLERVPADVVALGVLVLLSVLGLLPPEQAFAGFGSEAVIMILGLLILTAALVRTGVVDWVGRLIVRQTGTQASRILAMVLLIPALLSTVISNTAATAFFLPVVIGLGRKARINLSLLLMPLAFATILASGITLIATSTNIVVSGLMIRYQMEPLGLFELTPVGIPILVAGLLYMYFVGPRLIPHRDVPADPLHDFDSTPYLTETIILPDSPLAGKTLGQSGLGRDLDLTVVRLIRNKRRYLAPQADLMLYEGDVLLVEGQRDEILKIKNTAGIDIKADVKLSDPGLQSNDVRLVEAILLPRSGLIGRTLKGISFRERFGLQVLAINRHGETIRRKISRTSLRLGDVLLIQGNRANIRTLEEEHLVRVLDTLEEKLPNTQRAPIAVGAFIGAILLAAFELVSLPVALLMGVLVVFVTRCITPEEAYREVEWRALILIGSMLALGFALEHTGAAQFLAMLIVRMFGDISPTWLLGGFFILTMLLTQPMSNQAAAVVVVPVAVQTAFGLGLNPRAFTVMIALAASTSFLTPLEPACLMVYGPGRYRFLDFLKVGSLLTVLVFLIAITLVPMLWPLEG